jgi:hypothetical protein
MTAQPNPHPTLPEAISAALDARQAAAEAATVDGGDWFARDPKMPEFHMYGDFGWVVSGPDVETDDSEWGKAVADHIAANDPASTLRRVAADRKLLALHTFPAPACYWTNDGGSAHEPDEVCDSLLALAEGLGVEA